MGKGKYIDAATAEQFIATFLVIDLPDNFFTAKEIF